MVGQDTHLFRVGLLSVIGKVVVDQVAIEMFSRNSIEAVNKALQTAVIGVHALNVVKSKLIDFYTF